MQENTSRTEQEHTSRTERERMGRFLPPSALAARLLARTSRALSRLTEGFWEAVCEELFADRLSISARFVSVLLFLSGAGLVSVACLFECALGVFPIPFALLSCTGAQPLCIGTRRVSPRGLFSCVVFGVGLSLFFLPHALLRAVFLLCYLGLRLFLGGGALREGVGARILFSSLFSAALCLWEWVFFESGHRAGEVLVAGAVCALFSAAFCAAVTALTARRQEDSGEGRRFSLFLLSGQQEVYVCLALLCLFLCAFSATSRLELLFCSPAMVGAGLLTLLFANRRGALYGALCGALCGFAAAGETGAMCLFSAGLLSGLAFSAGLFVGVSTGFLSCALFLLVFASASRFAESGADLLLSHLLGFFLLRVSAQKVRAASEEERSLSLHARSSLQRRLCSLSSAFSSLSEVFYMATDATHTEEGELALALVRRASERVCVRCRESTDCWQHNYGLTQSALRRLSLVLSAKREVCEQDLEEYFRTRCKRAQALCREINRLYAEAHAPDARPSPASLLLGQYDSVSRLLSDTARQALEEENINRRATAQVSEVLKQLGIPHRACTVTGGRCARVTVTGLESARLSVCTDELCSALARATGMHFEPPELQAPLSDATMVLNRRRALSLSCARAAHAKGDQPISGDATAFFESDSQYFYALICDGMGSGRDAAFVSRLSEIFIEKLLSFSQDRGVTLSMLNRFLLSQDQERFSTVDLLEVDFYTGRANFIKAGAAASYVKRGTGLYRIAAKSPPAGILGQLTAAQTNVQLCGGDVVVMFSDGLAPSEEGEAWLAQTLAFSKERTAASLASFLLSEARSHYGAFLDDMSVAVLEVKSA